MATKLDIMKQIVIDTATAFPDLTAGDQIYLAPRIKAITGMSTLEIQIAEGASEYPEHESCRSEDFVILIGIFRKYRLDSGERHAKALTDLVTSLFTLKQTVIDLLTGSFLTDDLLTRPLIIKAESVITEEQNGQLLKTLSFLGGLNTSML